MRVVCVGGGPAGLYLAILMGRDVNHELTVLERNPPGVTYGWGVVFWDDLVDELRSGDPDTAREISANSFRWDGQLLAVEGRRRSTSPATGTESAAGASSKSWPRGRSVSAWTSGSSTRSRISASWRMPT